MCLNDLIKWMQRSAISKGWEIRASLISIMSLLCPRSSQSSLTNVKKRFPLPIPAASYLRNAASAWTRLGVALCYKVTPVLHLNHSSHASGFKSTKKNVFCLNFNIPPRFKQNLTVLFCYIRSSRQNLFLSYHTLLPGNRTLGKRT